MEKWKEVPHFGGRYEVSDLGRVRKAKTGKVLTPRGFVLGDYPRVGLTPPYERLRVIHRVDRLVMAAFCPPPAPDGAKFAPYGWRLNHKDGDRQNCALGNLEWVEVMGCEK